MTPATAATHSDPMPGLLPSAFRVLGIALPHMLWSRRTIFMGMVAGVPVLIGLGARALDGAGLLGIDVDGAQVGGPVLFGLMIWALYLRFIVPVLGVFYGTGLIADEVDDKTITYLFTRPIPRGAVLLGKYLAYLVCTVMVILPSVVVVYLLVVPIGGALAGSFGALLTDLAILAAGLAVYGAVFALIGAVIRRPLVVGLAFVLGWEPMVLVVPGYLRLFTVAHYLQGLVPHAMPQRDTLGFLQALFREVPSTLESTVWLLAIWVASLGLAVAAVGWREYVVEQ